MKILSIKKPDSVNESELKKQIAAILFEKAIMSSGQAAELIGISKREFLENVGKYEFSIFGENIDDIEKIVDE